MSDLLSSATKVVLLWVMAILGVVTTYSSAIGVYRGTLDPKDILAIFGSVVTFIIGFYFSKRESTTPDGTVTSQKTSSEVTTVKPNDTPQG